MLEGLDGWNGDGERAAGGGARAPRLPDGIDDDRRLAERFCLTGAELFLFVDHDQRYRLRVRDVCCAGLSGLTDAPINLGERLVVQFEELLMPAAVVIWTRRAMVGLQLVNPIPPARMRRLCERHAAGTAWSPAMRAGSDLHSWWTDLAAQQGGRRPRLRAGGHKHPLAR